MVAKTGQVKITTVMSESNTRTRIFNIAEKNYGTYTETLTELVSMEVVYTDDTGSYVVDSASELGEGHRVYPCVTAEEQVAIFKENAADTVEWTVPLTEVVG